MTTTLQKRWLAAGAALGMLLLGAACSSFFDVKNTNQPNLEDLITNPTRTKLAAAATGVFASARTDIQGHIWRLGSLGREGINLSGNNQPDYQEPYFLPALIGSGFGGALWGNRYAAIRNTNIYLTGLARVGTGEVSVAEKAASRGMANTMKALALMYVIVTRDSLGAPVNVDIPITAPPAPFVPKDSVYGHIIGLLDSAHVDLVTAGGTAFPFPIPPGFSGLAPNALDFGTPAKFIRLNRALAAKAEVLRATAGTCGGTPANCWNKALTALGASFISDNPAAYRQGAYFDFSNAAGDVTNGLSEPLNGVTFYAHPSDSVDAQLQLGGNPDQRVIDKIVAAQDTQVLGGIPEVPGEQKFTLYFTAGQADPARPIPIIRNEELILLRAEANIALANLAVAVADLDSIRIHSGGLPPYAGLVTQPALLTELLYNRRYSLLWEQGTRWIDARRYGRLNTIPKAPPTGGDVAPVMPVPDAECAARGKPTSCTPLFP